MLDIQVQEFLSGEELSQVSKEHAEWPWLTGNARTMFRQQ